MTCLNKSYERFQYFSSQFERPELLSQALNHSSYAHELQIFDHHQRLEFLGDGFLGFVMTEEIYRRFTAVDEGTLSKLRSALVNAQRFADLAMALNLDQQMKLGKSERLQKLEQQTNLLADMFEAVWGALVVDRGFVIAQKLFLEFIVQLDLEKQASHELSFFHLGHLINFDPRSRLQELTLKYFKVLPLYKDLEIARDGQTFYQVELLINNHSLQVLEHVSKKKAKELLARFAVQNWTTLYPQFVTENNQENHVC